MEKNKNTKSFIDLAKRRGFFWQSSEIYGGTSGIFDYGPLGLLLKRKLIEKWRDFFVRQEDNVYEIEASLIQPEKVFEASGHLDSFIDPVTQCKKCNSIFRADNLIEEKTKEFVEGKKPEELTKIIKENNIKCPKCKGELTKVKVFNLMVKTFLSPTEDEIAYLRPETAQGIFIDFKRILVATRAKLPFGVAQIGSSFRNEISPRQFLIRLRAFNQMEVEWFVDPDEIKIHPRFREIENVKIRVLTRKAQEENGKETVLTATEALRKKIVPNQNLAYFLARETQFYQSIGLPFEAFRFRHMLPEETPHYSKGNFDLEINFDFGWKEVVGNAYRTDHDLKSHMEKSGVDLTVRLDDGTKVIPHVVEPSFGIERTIYGILFHCYRDDKERGWEWFAFPPSIAPYSVGVFPLVNKDGLQEKAKEVFKLLKKRFDVFYDDSGSIGRRYARADEVGTPFGVTIDYDTMENDTVTLRYRDTTKQDRAKIEDLIKIIYQLIKS
ncbi:MAG: glycine--tRNA ligase [Candidatus Aenigmarchaeota archaeon]|nr:glycine--tRNA ligase [Candidatus Aenigmarchaeota archaeon]